MNQLGRNAGLGEDPNEIAHTAFWQRASLDLKGLYYPAKALCAEYGGGDFDETCLGFLDVYYMLAMIIPKDRVIYDVGCAHAFQSVFFLEHRKYVGIDPMPAQERLRTTNATHRLGTIEACHDGWIAPLLPIDPVHFAIHNAVPGGERSVRLLFTDLFTMYPRFHEHPAPRIDAKPRKRST